MMLLVWAVVSLPTGPCVRGAIPPCRLVVLVQAGRRGRADSPAESPITLSELSSDNGAYFSVSWVSSAQWC